MKDKKQLAYDYIKEKIISGEYAPLLDLSEKEIAELLGISRTPVHEALARLEDENFVKRYPQKGTFVTEITPDRIRSVYEARLLVEPRITALSVGIVDDGWLKNIRSRLETIPQGLTEREEKFYLMNLDTEFHTTLSENCSNVFLRTIMRGIYDHDRRLRQCTFTNDKQIHHSQGEHIEILNALLEGDRDRAETLAKEHIENSRDMTYVSLGFRKPE